MARTLSIKNLQTMVHKAIPFKKEWEAAFGRPERTGLWIVWGKSTNGKTSFVYQLSKELCKLGLKVLYYSLEEGTGLTVKNNIIRHNMVEVDSRFKLESPDTTVEELSEKLKKRNAPDVLVIDSFQFMGVNWPQFRKFWKEHPNKLIIVISQAEGLEPLGRSAQSVKYAASLKIHVEGYRAFSKGRTFGDKKAIDVWKEKAVEYWKKEL